MATCETCRWWDKRAAGHTYADCRRLPPRNTLGVTARDLGSHRVEVTLHATPHASWPNTAHDDWCGEHETRAEA